jgi:hypothetical protein
MNINKQIKELEKGCGKEIYCSYSEYIHYCGDGTRFCDIFQAKLQTFKECKAQFEEAFEKLKKRISIQGNLSHRIVEINGEYKHLHDYVLNEIVIDIINEIKSEVIGK